jgi:hypothetical protein
MEGAWRSWRSILSRFDPRKSARVGVSMPDACANFARKSW